MSTAKQSPSHQVQATKRRKTATKGLSSSNGNSPINWGALSYNPGFGNEVSSEALPDALPKGQNNPQKCPYGLYAEQLSGTAFTAPRSKNQRSWLYRIRPSVVHSRFVPHETSPNFSNDFGDGVIDPNQMRWMPMPLPAASSNVDFVQGLVSLAGSGSTMTKEGLGVHMYACNRSMGNKAFHNSDGDLLIVPQLGELRITTEFGRLQVKPCEICVIQRGIKFTVDLDEGVEGFQGCRGYVCELYTGHFVLPDLGPIGANGLANARDFMTPTAAFQDIDVDAEYTIVNKFGGRWFQCSMSHCPFDVVAWHGNYAPYKYDLNRFCTMNSVSYDHPDPSIYTVLTAQSNEAGTAICDFVIFPPRWMVMEKSFRPPYYHRNIMTEFMGMIYGQYDAKAGGFVPGGASLHSCCTPHGPDATTFDKASNAELVPHKFEDGLAFMFETNLVLKLSKYAMEAPHNDQSYQSCWQGLPKLFKGGE